VRGPIEIVVDELVVRGLAPDVARNAAASFEAHLTALAGTYEGAIASRAESFRLESSVDVLAGSPEALGSVVAGAVWNGIAGGESQ
jgi:hypothetical protein